MLVARCHIRFHFTSFTCRISIFIIVLLFIGNWIQGFPVKNSFDHSERSTNSLPLLYIKACENMEKVVFFNKKRICFDQSKFIFLQLSDYFLSKLMIQK